jgi:ABC-type transport system substrate-binding protein
LEVPLFWDGHLCSNGAAWSDPKGNELGSGAKWFKYDPAEAKKLMDAAGYKGAEMPYVSRANFGPTNMQAVISEMLKAGGFNVKDQVVQADEWRRLKTSFVVEKEGFFWGTANSFNDDDYLVVSTPPPARSFLRQGGARHHQRGADPAQGPPHKAEDGQDVQKSWPS